MKTTTTPASTCRLCKYFQPEGRRGGFCQKLGASVRGGWEACAIAIPPFAPSWEDVEQSLYRTTAKIESEVTPAIITANRYKSSVWNHAEKCQLSVTKKKFNSLTA
jgi:hypothetical protein